MTPGDWTRALTGLTAGAAWYLVNLVLGVAPALREVEAPSGGTPSAPEAPNVGPPADLDRPATPSQVTISNRPTPSIEDRS